MRRCGHEREACAQQTYGGFFGAQYCPGGVIDRELNIDLDYCKGCGVCANECPKQAITMVREER